MKYSLIFIIASLFILSSCDKNGSIDDSTYVKEMDFPINPMEHIHRSMIVCHFGVSSAKLDYVEEIITNDNSLSVCGFEWEKTNHDEIQDHRSKMMMAYAINGTSREDGLSKKVDVFDLKKLKSANNYLKIGLFREYANFKSAKSDFYNSHQVSSNIEINKSADIQVESAGLTIVNSGESRKFTAIEGIGNQAYYNHNLKSLDVLFGNISFSVFIDSEFDIETDILIAKKIAYEVWKGL
ncbi:hypothetical protein [Brumimicrobium mesophilum]|uniref:hypothetical protein n=1 Tax=Brumimicrobium mesophilum TaxID=392717 RepID=UPI000D141147|nr:hypothetical protein [Brumimicrobium mesophilum]